MVSRTDYEVDHLIPLELGGSNKITNLWPQPLDVANGARDKDTIENELHSLVCSGEVALSDAQSAVVHWDIVNLATLVSTTTTMSTVPPETVPPLTLPSATTSPPTTTAPVVPSDGPTALCNNRTSSYAAHHQGACSHHGGVAEFYK